jgi:hypothetical protein
MGNWPIAVADSALARTTVRANVVREIMARNVMLIDILEYSQFFPFSSPPFELPNSM